MNLFVCHTFVLLISFVLLLCVPTYGDTSTTLYNKTIDVPYPQTCVAARMEYVARNKDCARQRVDALQHYERRGHADGQLWRGELCNVAPSYVNDSFCQCTAAINTYVQDNPTVQAQDAWNHYLTYLDTLARTWHCEKCLGNHSDLCIAARRDYRLRYNLNNTEPAFHYYTWGMYLGYFWNSSLCYSPNMSTIIYMDSNVSNCAAGESWYNNNNPGDRNLTNGGFTTGYAHYTRYSMEFGAYWYEELCVDVENECKTGNNNCKPVVEICSNFIGDLGSYSCGCSNGYTGSPCEDFNECAVSTTNNCPAPNSLCINTNGSFYCICKSGFTGPDECRLEISNCSSIQQCENTIGGYRCKCPLFYDTHGDYACEYDCAFPFKSCGEGWCIPLEMDGGGSNASSSCTVHSPCNDSSPYHCADGSCAQVVTNCAMNHSQPIVCNETTLCWDGSCADDVDLCPTLPECPATLRRCLDGTCNDTCATTTCAAPNRVCADGLCAQICATNWNGCPHVLPIMCPNGLCTRNVSDCVTGEFIVARTLRAQVMTVYFPVGSIGPSETNISVPVLSESDLLMFTLVFGESYFENQPGLLFVTPVPDSQAYAAGKTLWGAGFEPSNKIFSAPVKIFVNGSALSFTKQFRVNFNPSTLSLKNSSELCLGIINETSQQWTCHGPLYVSEDSIYGFAIPGRMAIILAPGLSAVPIVKSPRHERTVGIYMFAGIVVLYSVGLIFASLRDRKVFIEIVTETIKREGSVTAITGIPYQPAAVEETPQEDPELTQREMVKRGATMPNIVLSDEVRAKRMAHTKHAVVLTPGERSSMCIPHQPSETFYSAIGPERTARAMTFDSAYPHPPHANSIFDPTVSPAIPPFNPHRARRSGVAEQAPAPSPSPSPSPSPLTFAPEGGLRSSFKLSGKARKNTVITFGTSHSSNSSEEDPQAVEMDDLSRSSDLISVPSPTPLVPRLANPDVMVQEQARKLEWEVSVRAHTGTEIDLHKMSLWELIKLKHTWLSVFFTQRTSRLTCVEQLTILLCMVMGNLGISAPFFHNLTDFDISKCIIVAIITATLVWVVTIFITIMFQNVIKTIHTLVIFAIAIIFSCFCIALAMSYSYNFVLDATEMWVVAFAIACVQDVLVNQPFKVLVIALLYGWLSTDHWLVKLL